MIRKLKSFYFVWSQYLSPGTPGWHLDIIEQAETMPEVAELGGQFTRERQLNMEQMAGYGYTLEAISTSINEDVLGQLEAANARIAELEGQMSMAANREDPAGGEPQEL